MFHACDRTKSHSLDRMYDLQKSTYTPSLSARGGSSRAYCCSPAARPVWACDLPRPATGGSRIACALMKDASPIRYTIQFDLRPTDRAVTYTVVTGGGVLKAVAMAAGRFERDAQTPQEQISSVSLLNEEADFSVDSERDLLDHWEIG